MSERKYTDEEIINKMSAYIEMSCRMCGFKTLCNELCAIEFIKAALKAALGLIKSQKAEIEKWKKNCDELYGQMSERQKAEVEIARRMGKAEAVKEFAERLKANMCHGYIFLEIEEDLFRRDVDNLVAEMTEGWTRGKGDSFSQYGGYVTVTAIEEMTEGE